MGRKVNINGNADTKQDQSSLASDPFPTVTVNNANLAEIKAALDDIIKKYLNDQSFTASNVNPTIHLSLGYASIIFSLGGVLYLYLMKTPFEESKPLLWVSVIGYFFFQGILWGFKRWVEKGEVFKGKRRRVIKRIETDHVHLFTTTNLDAPPQPQITFSPHSRPSSPTFPATESTSTISPASTGAPSDPTTSSPSSAKKEGPTFLLNMTVSTTSNNGKSLIRKSRVLSGKGIGEFVDEAGGVEEGEVRRWFAGLLNEAGLAGEEDDGLKEQ